MLLVIDFKDDTPLPLVFRFDEPMTDVAFERFRQHNPDYLVTRNDDGSINYMPRWAIESDYKPSERAKRIAQLEPGYYAEEFFHHEN